MPELVAANVSVSAHGSGGPRRMPADHPIADDHHLAVARAENAFWTPIFTLPAPKRAMAPAYLAA